MPDLIDDLRAIASKIEKSRDLVSTEEATKNAFVMPFIAALGYDVFDPREVTPELVADVGVKKGEKIDYAILRDGRPIILFECKHHGANLDVEHASQLFRYFAVTDSRIAVLTNGVEYRFYTDLEAPNKMDARPFLVFSMLDVPDHLVPELKKLSKEAFDLESILSTANELKYLREIKAVLSRQLTAPSEDFVRFCAASIGVSRMTQSVREQFAGLTQKAFSAFISDCLRDRLKSALGATSSGSFEPAESSRPDAQEVEPSNIETTVEELEGFYIVKAILRDVVDVRRVFYRDQQSYFSILMDNNNRRPIARLYFNGVKQKYVGVFSPEKKEERVAINSVDDIYELADRLREVASSYE